MPKKILIGTILFIFATIFGLYMSTYLPLPIDTLQISRQKSGVILMKDRHGYLLREAPVKSGLKGRWVGLSEISPHLIAATIAAEDKRFYSHPGFDILAIIRATFNNIDSGRITSGGSTITQQVIKNTFGLKRNYHSKLIEIWYAARLEHTLSKEQILEIYLNTLPYGNQVIGAEAASILYLGKPCAYLTYSEGAFLASIPQSPTRYNPYSNKDSIIKRKNRILSNMLHNKTISVADYKTAIDDEISLYTDKSPFKAQHFTDWILQKLPANIVGNGGEVITTLDLPLQEKVEKLLRHRIGELQKDYVTNGSVIVLDNRTGDVLVMVGSVDYFGSGSGQVNGALSLRQPGSSVKPFTYSVAFERGYTPATLIPDVETHIGDYTPRNYDDNYHGPALLRTALASSYNIPAVRVADDVGVGIVLKRMRELGIDSLHQDSDYYGAGLTLGNGEVTLLEMSRGYMAIANGGEYLPERVFITGAIPKPVPVFSPEVAYLLTDILSDPAARAPAFGRNGPLELPFAVAAKTGTTSDFRDNWTIGYSRDYTVGVWVGNFNGLPMEGVSGVTGAAPLFRDIFIELYSGKDNPQPFIAPKNIIYADICSLSGDKPDRYCKTVKREVFIAGTEPKNTCEIHRNYLLDKRDGLLAGPYTPSEYMEEKIYEVYPPVYAQWAALQEIPAPPAIASPIGVTQGEMVMIISPKNGDVFNIDPAIPADAQSIPLKAIAPGTVTEVIWEVDGVVIARTSSPYTCLLPLSPGRYRVTARSGMGGSGQPVFIEVKQE